MWFYVFSSPYKPYHKRGTQWHLDPFFAQIHWNIREIWNAPPREYGYCFHCKMYFWNDFSREKEVPRKTIKILSSFLTHIAPTQIVAQEPVLYIKIHFSSLCAIIDIIFYGNDVLYVLRILDTALLINNPDRSLNNYHISEGYKNSTTYLKNE